MRRFTSVLLFFFFLSCGLLGSKDKGSEIKPIFTAEINGEVFDGTTYEESAKAGITLQGKYPYLSIVADQYSEEFYPNNEAIGINVIYTEGIKKYSTKKDTVKINEDFDRFLGGVYYESDGDASISWYASTANDEGYITIETDTMENGEVVIFGMFEMTVVVETRADSYSHRVGQDTLYITNGEYRLLLDDRRD